MTGPFYWRKPCQQDCIVECRTNLADAAAHIDGVFAINDDTGILITGITCAGTDNGIEG